MWTGRGAILIFQIGFRDVASIAEHVAWESSDGANYYNNELTFSHDVQLITFQLVSENQTLIKSEVCSAVLPRL